jgi:hypothetical protein
MTQEAEDDRKAKLKVGCQTHHYLSIALDGQLFFCRTLHFACHTLHFACHDFFVSCDALYFGRYALNRARELQLGQAELELH